MQHRQPSIVACAVANDLLNGNLLRTWGSRLRNNNREDAVVQARFDLVLVDMAGEREAAVEFAHGALAHPVAVLVVVGLGGHGLVFVSGLDDATVVVVVLAFFSSTGRRAVGGGGFALGAALDHQSLVVGELDFNVLLRDSGQLTVEVVGVITLADIEARRERTQRGALSAAGAVDVVVVQQAEERSEVSGSRHGAEERHSGGVGCQRLFVNRRKNVWNVEEALDCCCCCCCLCMLRRSEKN